jgi:hypothetical protein
MIVVGGKIQNISGDVSNLTGLKWQDNGTVLASNGFNVVQHISHALHGHKNVGGKKDQFEPVKPTPSHFRAGFSLLHQSV